MDETAIAFAPPHVRAALGDGALDARAAGAGAPERGALDRISVRDYVRRVEIGAFAAERGTEQRLRFNVVLEVCHHAAAETDDVDQVISYDTITAAIEAEIARERINLLETLAERVAADCLADPRSVRVFVRIEKLDRVPGALGVEIVRRRAEGALRLRPAAAEAPGAAPAFAVVHLANAVLDGPAGAGWCAALASAGPCLVALGADMPPPAAAGRGGCAAGLRAGLLGIDRRAWTLAALEPRLGVAASRTEIAWALGQGMAVLWAPTKLVTDAVGGPPLDAARPADLALWAAGLLGARALLTVGPAAITLAPAVPVTALDPGRPERLGAALAAACAPEPERHPDPPEPSED